MAYTTTLRRLRENNACAPGMQTLLASLPDAYGEDEPISLLHILESNGWAHAIWATRAADGGKELAVRIAIECAEAVLPIFEKQFPADRRPREAIEAAKNGGASSARAAGAATWAARAAGAATWAARAAYAAANAARAAYAATWAAEAAEAAARCEETNVAEIVKAEIEK